MSTPETPDAAPGADAPAQPAHTDPVDTAATAVLPPPYVDTRPPAWQAPAQTAVPERPAPAASVDLTGPRIRWAGIVWGLVLAAIAATALWILLDPARQAVLTSWLVGLNPATAIAIAVLLLGMFALITGVVGIARRAQRGLERRRASSSPART
ncbi:hypothetical protein [Microbacterium sp. ProA8]|uniref:hypothetical protein n=1 Tax=Microbacterium chionoecetis TaxID=3153754 RepID=UPI003263721A